MMSTDIAERLRRGWGFCSSDDTEEAADEIERLRAEKAHWEHIYQALDADRARLREEIERLQKSLAACRHLGERQLAALMEIDPRHPAVTEAVEIELGERDKNGNWITG